MPKGRNVSCLRLKPSSSDSERDDMSINTDPQQQKAASPQGVVGRSSSLCQMTDDEMFAGLNVARERIKAAGGLRLVPRPVQVALIVSTAQGIIDNGGLQYLYEADFEDQSPYSDFVDGYREIGAMEAADFLERSARMFPFGRPHLYEAKRQKWLDEIRDVEGHEFHVLSDRLVGNKSVFPKLMEYMEMHRKFFGVA